MHFVRLFACALAWTATAWAADPTPTPSPSPTPSPNKVSLQRFKGAYFGRSEVILGKFPSYRGRADVRMSSSSERALRVEIEANVKTPRGRASIGNLLTFSPLGKVAGRELAPGIARRAPFTGIYTATKRRISFQGDYAFGETSGRFVGFITSNAKGHATVHYDIFVNGTTDAVYTYDYRIFRPKK